MNKDTWKEHIEATEGITRPSIAKTQESIVLWKAALQKHADSRCVVCLKRKAQIRHNLQKREKNAVLREVCGTSARAARADMGL